MLTNNSYLYVQNFGPIDATLDGDAVFSMCIDFFSYSPVPTTIQGHVIAPLDYSDPIARVHAVAMHVLLNSGIVHAGATDNNPLTPFDGNAVKWWQHATWEATTALTPDFTTTLTSSSNTPFVASSDSLTAVMLTNLAQLTTAQFLSTGGSGFAQFAGQLSYFIPDNKTDQRFLVYNPNSVNTPEPGTMATLGGGMLLIIVGMRKRK